MARRRSIRTIRSLVLLEELLALETGQALQAHVEDRLRLDLGEARSCSIRAPRASSGVWLARMVAMISSMVERLEQAFEDVGAVLGLAAGRSAPGG